MQHAPWRWPALRARGTWSIAVEINVVENRQLLTNGALLMQGRNAAW